MEGTTEHISSPIDLSETKEKGKADKGNMQSKPKMNNADGSAASEKPASMKPPSKRTPAAAISAAERAVTPREPVELTLRTLLQAGVHYGHQTSRWSPAMAPYIHSSRNGIHIINLPRTISAWEKAREKVLEVASRGGSILFVGTKKQAQDPVVEEARRCGAFYVSRRWLGGMMTNFQTIRKSIDRLQKLEKLLAEETTAQTTGGHTRFTKKERLMMSRERDKLEYSLGGIRTMNRAPQLMFVIDVRREEIAIREANRLDIPVVALVDTNCDPRTVRYPIPSNDDGTRAIRLFCSAIADAAMEGRKIFDSRRQSIPTPVVEAPVEAAQVEAAKTEAAPATDAAEAKETPAETPVADDVLARWGLNKDEDSERGRR